MTGQSWIISGASVAVPGFFAWVAVSAVEKSRRAIRATVSKGMLHFTRLDGAADAISVDQVVEIVDISCEGRGQAFEMVMSDGRRIILHIRPVGGGFRVFVERMQRANPKIRSAVRENECHACGADLRIRMDKCPRCGEAIGKPVGVLV